MLLAAKVAPVLQTAPQPTAYGTAGKPFEIIAVGRKKYHDVEHRSGSEEQAQEVLRATARQLHANGIGMTLAIPGYELDALSLGI